MMKVNKILVGLIVIFLLIGITSQVFAINPNDYKPKSESESATVTKKFNAIFGAFQAVGSIVSVVALIVIGLKYMLTSVEERAEMKTSLIFYVIGAILVFAISNVSQIIYDWASKL